MGTISNRQAARNGLVHEELVLRREAPPARTEVVRGESGESYFGLSQYKGVEGVDLKLPKMFGPMRFPLGDFIGLGGAAMGLQEAKPLPPLPSHEEEVDRVRAILAADAERAPTFSAARKAAILNAFEKHPSFAGDLLTSLLAGLHAYEYVRGWKAAPDETAQAAGARAYWKERNGRLWSDRCPFLSEAIEVYERCRGIR